MSGVRRSLAGCRFLVTGASSGLGYAIAARLVGMGALVWGTSRRPDQAVFPEGVTSFALDLSDPRSVDTFWKENCLASLELDGVINNAGYATFGAIERYVDSGAEKQLDVLLLGAMQICRLAIPELRRRKGVLVNVSSLASQFPIPYQSVYSAAKAGLSAFSESLMMEEGSKGLQIIDFQPGDFCTEFHKRMSFPESEKGDERARKVWSKIQSRSDAAPKANFAANRLVKAIESGRSGTVRSGTFFQAVVAPLLDRFGSNALRRYFNMGYYK